MPKCSPLIVTLVPGGPSFGEIPVTTGLLAIGKKTKGESSTKLMAIPFGRLEMKLKNIQIGKLKI